MKELRAGGHLNKYAKVDGFVLGDKIEEGENETIKHGDEVKIHPMMYDTILLRAEKRLLNLNTKVKSAPFLAAQQEELAKFVEPIPITEPELAEVAQS